MIGVDDLTAKVVNRFANKKFDSMYDLQLYMESLPGWKRVKGLGSDYITFGKRIGNVVVEVGWNDNVWNKDLFVMARMPRNIEYGSPEHEAAKDKLFQRINNVPGKTWRVIEALVLDVAKAWKSMAKRRKKDPSGIRYQPGYGQDTLQGKEAYQRWLADVEEWLQESIDKSAQHGADWTTRDLVDHLMQVHTLSNIMGVSRRDIGKAVSRLLNLMAKRNKIEKDTNEPRNPKWLGLNWVPKPRPRSW